MGFLGLTGYYCKFVQNYGLIAAPVTNLLKKGNLVWTPLVDQSLDELEQAMVTTPVLALPKFAEQFVVETDASDQGIGAVLGQNGWPVALLSKVLRPSKWAWLVYAREM